MRRQRDPADEVGAFVSIHAPARGATSASPRVISETFRFNSRTREGCDYPSIKKACKKRGFNSRTREGCDTRQILRACIWSVSIHAPARGATASPFRRLASPIRFKSRTREGCDDTRQILRACIWSVSIHAPARGATPVGGAVKISPLVSIHAPARGATFDRIRKKRT